MESPRRQRAYPLLLLQGSATSLVRIPPPLFLRVLRASLDGGAFQELAPLIERFDPLSVVILPEATYTQLRQLTEDPEAKRDMPAYGTGPQSPLGPWGRSNLRELCRLARGAVETDQYEAFAQLLEDPAAAVTLFFPVELVNQIKEGFGKLLDAGKGAPAILATARTMMASNCGCGTKLPGGDDGPGGTGGGPGTPGTPGTPGNYDPGKQVVCNGSGNPAVDGRTMSAKDCYLQGGSSGTDPDTGQSVAISPDPSSQP
jgi:hypothetical protein